MESLEPGERGLLQGEERRYRSSISEDFSKWNSELEFPSLSSAETAVEEEVGRKLGKYLRKLVTSTMNEHGWSSTSSSALKGRSSIVESEQATVTQNLLQTVERRLSNIETCMLHTRDVIDRMLLEIVDMKHALSSESPAKEGQQVPTTVCVELRTTNKLLKLLLMTQCATYIFGSNGTRRGPTICHEWIAGLAVEQVEKVNHILDEL